MRKIAVPLLLLFLILPHWAGAEDLLAEAKALNSKVVEFYGSGRYEEAIPYAQRALQILENALGQEHLDVATSLYNLAELYRKTGRYADAEPLDQRALEIKEKALGKEHPYVAASLNSLGRLYYATGRYAQAEPLYQRALQINEKVLGKGDPEVAISLDNLAKLYNATGRYAEAEPLYQQALQINEKALGKEHPDVATSLNNLAVLYHETGRYAEAEPLYHRALQIREKTDHPYLAASLNNLAGLYRDTGRYAAAEPLFQRALQINEKALGKEHPEVAMILNNLAGVYDHTGRYAAAELLCRRALQIREKALGKEHPDVANNLNDLAALYHYTGRYAEAEPLYQRALQILEKALGMEHPDVATSMNNLAVLYRETGRYAEAEPLIQRALQIREKVLGKEHPYVADSLNNLATLYYATGRYAAAELLYQRALQIREKVLGKEHPDVATILSNLVALSASLGRHPQAHFLFLQSLAIQDQNREDAFLLLSERQKLAYIQERQGDLHAFLSHTFQFLASDPSAPAEALEAWLRWKGVVMEAQSRYLEASSSSPDPKIQEKFDALTLVRRTRASLQMSRPQKMSFEEYRRRLAELEQQKGALEVELSRLSKEFALERLAGKADVKRIASLLPRGCAYVDFARIQPYDFTQQKYGPARYLAFVLLPSPLQVRLLDLGPAEAVDEPIATYLQAMEELGQYLGRLGEVDSSKLQKITRTQEEAARTLYALLMQPLLPLLQGRKQLFISPDGNLNRMPFEVLPTPQGRVLLDDYLISYIGAGRDIVRFSDESLAQGPALLLADPDYDLGSEEREKQAQALHLQGSRLMGGISRDAGSLSFGRLPETKVEANAIEQLLKEKYHLTVRNLQDRQALEEVLWNCVSPLFLHLSTHGYFLPDEVIQERQRMLWGSGEQMPDPGIENPMLRSGLALAGANTALKEGSDAGLVSAEKILGLSLKGTELVVLSACETGLGEVQSGEGVFGLKRSFILSGAKTVVLTLWKIPVQETVELMTIFYTQMAEGKPKAEALREAKLRIKEKHPRSFYWGAPVLVGKAE